MKKITILAAIIALTATIATAQQTSGTIQYEITTDMEKMMKWFMPDREMSTYAWKNEWKISFCEVIAWNAKNFVPYAAAL